MIDGDNGIDESKYKDIREVRKENKIIAFYGFYTQGKNDMPYFDVIDKDKKKVLRGGVNCFLIGGKAGVWNSGTIERYILRMNIN